MSFINDFFVQLAGFFFFRELRVFILNRCSTYSDHQSYIVSSLASTVVLYNVLHCLNLFITLLHCTFFSCSVLCCLLPRFCPAVPCTVLLFPALYFFPSRSCPAFCPSSSCSTMHCTVISCPVLKFLNNLWGIGTE
jgi:hypothetical protein